MEDRLLDRAAGILFVVATPIGHMDDLSVRARDTLASADLVAAEDTRRTGQLLSRLGVSVPLLSLHDHNETQRVPGLVRRLEEGAKVALVSDAGTPLVSDPGFRLVQAARAAGVRVVPVPGPSAVLAALSAAGLPTDRFVFEGFLPARRTARRTRLEALANERRTLVVFEAPARLSECLEDMAAVFGAGRGAVLARELTKRHEQIVGATLDGLSALLADGTVPARGECVLVVEGAPEVSIDEVEARRVLELLRPELPPARAVRLAAAITGERPNRLKRLLHAAGTEPADPAATGDDGGARDDP